MQNWLRDLANVAPLLPSTVQVRAVLNSGGQGIVYEGTVSGADAAVKVYFPGQVQQRIDREVAALRSLACPSIVRMLWAGVITTHAGVLQVVATQLVPGVPLRARLASGPLAASELGALAYDVAAAIDALWAVRIVHRDLKPENIMMLPNGRFCVIDLGVARHLGQSSLTAAGMAWGTFGYMSPEQMKAVRKLTCKSDLFAMGVVLVEAAEGTHPTNGDQFRMIQARLDANLPARSAAWTHAALLRQLLAEQPQQRPRVSQVLATLAAHALGGVTP